jgi:hypothetical protein
MDHEQGEERTLLVGAESALLPIGWCCEPPEKPDLHRSSPRSHAAASEPTSWFFAFSKSMRGRRIDRTQTPRGGPSKWGLGRS